MVGFVHCPAYFHYWGKARPSKAEIAEFHLLVFHSLDVAAVGRIYLRRSKSLLKVCASLLRCSEDALLSWATFMLALHDLGKFSEAFQSQRADILRVLQEREPNGAVRYLERHDSLGAWLWIEELVEDGILEALGLPQASHVEPAIKSWIFAVTGHHGMPPKASGHVDSFFLETDKRAARDYVLAMADLLLTSEARAVPAATGADFELFSKLLSWWFSGVTVLADWLGSNTQFFHYRDSYEPLEKYWATAQRVADQALDCTGVLPVGVEKHKRLTDFFPYIQDPSPLQNWAETTPVDLAPRIYLLEDVTGAGKTEAAVMLAYRLMAQGAASGFFVGLPTMATANAMYKRISGIYGRLFEGHANLTLAHGFKSLVDEFAKSILPGDMSEDDALQADETASARCTAWLADHSKRALLAPASVGTIDQVLLSVLHSKHQSLRLLGLFNKVLIVDEVHACDTYMQKILEVVLEFHARSGGSVILLSATLPGHMKQSLLDAYARGRNMHAAPHVMSNNYPLATAWHDGMEQLKEDSLDSRPNVTRSVQIHYECDLQQVYCHVLSSLREGKCVAWIRNTVADAMAAYDHFSTVIEAEKLTLFHARFAMGDRLDKEAEVLRIFGSNSDATLRTGRLLIATQVAEQSLDIDADVLVTDLAPIDRVLQRAGRLQRHVRDAHGNPLTGQGMKDGRAAPCLWVYGPEWTMTPRRDWFGATFKGGQYVYSHHGQLWLSAKVLQADEFSVPGDARQLIETVFSGREPWPEALESNARQAEGGAWAESSLAQQNTLKFDRGYQRGMVGDWWNEAKSPSRLGEETREVMLARWDGCELIPWVDGAWAFSMVKIAARLLEQPELPAEAQRLSQYQALLQTLPAQGKWSTLLPLSPNGDGTWQASAWSQGDAKRRKPPELLTWLYDSKFGFRLARTDATTGPAD
ncbi:CRISPR-associated helicase/endonuclease Cas3 [Pseudoduganella namucuonensis]|uniref:CRISPR-associated endonuclease/helicase Cas3 n=1 Tax=Pseudoduganella namucuonensis TaxID=1035707 RepID=A0A1I7ETM3_9BURK|nr:CRISPR-associated helicase/endonuclease Cas3 [Pseudoduganella namucuonensis]SFU27249.1 CRISPR-associated endonuclease/helicase Cas3 [Pseudoduganella namucuonensis]